MKIKCKLSRSDGVMTLRSPCNETNRPIGVVNHHALFWLFQDSGSMKICSESECPICLEMLPAGANPEKVIPLPCGHSFHSSCASGKPREWSMNMDK